MTPPTSRPPGTPLAWLAALALFPGLQAAELPVRNYRVAYLPADFVFPGASHLNDRGTVFGVNLVRRGPSATDTEFILYRVAQNGQGPGSVQRIPGPVTGWRGQFTVLDVNNQDQFITSERSPGTDHRFVWAGGSFVELRDPRRPRDEDPVVSENVEPLSIHDDGSVWGVTLPNFAGATPDFGGVVQWDVSGAATAAYQFTSDTDPLRFGPARNDRGAYLRYQTDPLTRVLSNARLWNGLSSAPGPVVAHPASRLLRLNDRNELAGVAADSGEFWIHLPEAAYGLGAGLHFLKETLAPLDSEVRLNNAGEILVLNATNASRVWSRGSWSRMRVADADGYPKELRSLLDANASGWVLGGVVPVGSPLMPVTMGILTPVGLDVSVTVEPGRELEVGEEFHLVLQVRNGLDVPLHQVGIVVPTLVLTGDLIVDWIQAPPTLLTLPPGESGTLRYGFRTKASGKVRIRFRVQGLDAAGSPRALTGLLGSPEVRVLSPLKLRLLAEPENVELDDEISLRVVVSNSLAQAISGLERMPAIPSFRGDGEVEWTSGPTPPPPAALAAGASAQWAYRYRATRGREVAFEASVRGRLPDGAAIVSDPAVSATVQIGLLGDLLIKTGREAPDGYALDQVYQRVAAGAQRRTNVTDDAGVSEFHVAVVNRSRKPRTFRLLAVESGDGPGWEVRYRLDDRDVSAPIVTLGGLPLPELAPDQSLVLTTTLRLTNAVPGRAKRVNFALISPLAPEETLDAVEAISRVPEVQVRAIEVSQSVQDWANTVPLVVGKETMVRVHLEAPDPAVAPEHPVRGVLHGLRDGVPLAGSPIASLNENGLMVPRDAARVRDDTGQSLNFLLPREWIEGDLTLRWEALNARAVFREPAEPGGQAEDGLIVTHFVRVPDLPVIFHLTAEMDEDGTVHVPDLETLAAAIRWTEAMYPVAKLRWRLGTQLQIHANDIPDVHQFSKVYDQIRSIPEYAGCSGLQGCALHQAVLPMYFYKGNLRAGGGLAESNPGLLSAARLNFASFGGGNAPPHELGHLLGRPHTFRTGIPPAETTNSSLLFPHRVFRGECGEEMWADRVPPPEPFADYFPVGSEGFRPTLGPMDSGEDFLVYGLNLQSPGSPLVLDPRRHFETMSYCSSNTPWASKAFYRAILQTLQTRFGQGASPGPAAGGESPRPQLVIRGRFDLETMAVRLLPVRRLDAVRTPVDAAPSPLILELRDGSGQVLEAQPIPFKFPMEAGSLMEFFAMVPDRPEIREIRVAANGSALASLHASAHPPEVAIESPSDGEILDGGDVTFRWKAADEEATPLTYYVDYSSDGGNSWQSLATDCAEAHCVVPRFLIAGGRDLRLRVEASDGFWSTRTIGEHTFRVAANPPLVFAVSPAANDVVRAGQRVVFRALAYDPESAGDEGVSVRWSSDLEGPLGTGLRLERPVAGLRPGRHVITAEATDADGQRASTTTTLMVGGGIEPARLSDLRWTGSAEIEFQLRGTPGRTNVIEFSTDLFRWTPVQTNAPSLDAEVLRLPASAESTRFYLRVLTY